MAACGNIIPGIISIYEWKGNIETENEGKYFILTLLMSYNES